MVGVQEDGGEGRGGAGGKMTRRWRPLPATPYDRPRPSEGGVPRRRGGQEDGEGREMRWISKAKLLLRPVSRLLPPSFSPSAASSSTSTFEDVAAPGSSAAPPEVEQGPGSYVDIARQTNLSHAAHLNETKSSTEDDHPKYNSEINEQSGGRLKNTCNQIGLADIEKLLKQSTFSRDESSHLIKLLRSRTIGLAENDKDEIGLTVNNHGNAFEGRYVKRSVEEKKPARMDLSFKKRKIFEEVGSSPVEIAKTFMESRPSFPNHVLHGGLSGDDKILLHERDSPKSSMSLVVQMPQICRPGILVSDYSYFTPQSQKGFPMPHNIPQTPFPRGSFGKSVTKPHCSSEGCPNLQFAGWKQSATPIFGTNKTKISTPGGDLTAVPPIHGLEHENMMTALKGSTPYHSSSCRPLLASRSVVTGGTTSTMQKSLEPHSSRWDIVKHKAACGGVDSVKLDTDLSRVHSRSSEVARKILEHIERTVPSPQNKPFGSSFSVAKKTLLPSNIHIDRDVPSPQNKPLESNLPVEKKTVAPADMSKMLHRQDNRPCADFPKTSFLRVNNDINGNAEVPKANKEVSLSFRNSGTVAGSPGISKSLSLSQSYTNESAVTAISNLKPEKASRFPANGFGFSFPASSASNTGQPQATPTLSLHSSASGEETSPSFSFGQTGGRRIFAFGNIINTPDRDADNSVPSYRFGSDDGSRLCFRSFIKDAICH